MVSREDLRRFIDGHRRAEAVLHRETLRRLASLTAEESRSEFDSLCRVWEASAGRDDPALDPGEIAHRVALRRKLAGRR